MFFCAQMQRMSHYYKAIVCHAYCMNAEYAIKMLLVKSVEIVEKNRPHRENITILISHDFFISRSQFANNNRNHIIYTQ